jgi:hypothetical protein
MNASGPPSRFGRFIFGEKSPDTHWIGDWVDPYRESNPSRTARRYND